MLTHADAIEADIARLSTLIPRAAWPATFIDVNAARNFVGQWCYDNKFRYAGWPDVEFRKYRLFVNFNAAKYALESDIFEVKRAVPLLAQSHAKKSAVAKEYEAQPIEVKASANEESGIVSVFGPVTGADTPDGCNRGDNTRSASASSSVSASLSSDEVDGTFTPATTEPQKEAAPVDPFKVSAPLN